VEVGFEPTGESGMRLERMAFCLRKRADHEAGLYFASLSSRTMVYKGMLSAPQVEPFFPDLSDQRYQSNLTLVHSRFSANTFPSWERAHPYRYIAHNGEINTISARNASSAAGRRYRQMPRSWCTTSDRFSPVRRRPQPAAGSAWQGCMRGCAAAAWAAGR
jgi:glutamate synthase domain-containing protein 1